MKRWNIQKSYDYYYDSTIWLWNLHTRIRTGHTNYYMDIRINQFLLKKNKNNRMNKFVTHKQNWMRWLDAANMYNARTEKMWKRKIVNELCATHQNSIWNFSSSETIDRSEAAARLYSLYGIVHWEWNIYKNYVKRASGKQRSMPPSFIAYIWIAITFSLVRLFDSPSLLWSN